MRNISFCLLVYIQVCLFSCEREQNCTTYSASLSVNSYDLFLPHGDYLLNNTSVVFKKAGQDSVILMDATAKSFIIGDLKKSKIVKSLPYVLEGPDFLDLPVRKLEWKSNQLFVLSGNFFTVYNASGQVIARTSLREVKAFDSYSIINFSIINKSQVLFAIKPYAANSPSFTANSNHSIFAVLDWKLGGVDLLPITSPDEAFVIDKNKGFYQDFSDHIGVYTDSSIYYQFAFSSKVYRYNLKTKETQVYPALSKLTKNERTPLPANHTTEEFVNYIYANEPKFSQFMYDSSTGLFARIYGQVDANGAYNKKYLMIFDNEMNVKYETELDMYITSGTRANFFSNGKVYIMHSRPETEDGYYFKVYEINQAS